MRPTVNNVQSRGQQLRHLHLKTGRIAVLQNTIHWMLHMLALPLLSLHRALLQRRSLGTIRLRRMPRQNGTPGTRAHARSRGRTPPTGYRGVGYCDGGRRRQHVCPPRRNGRNAGAIRNRDHGRRVRINLLRQPGLARGRTGLGLLEKPWISRVVIWLE